MCVCVYVYYHCYMFVYFGTCVCACVRVLAGVYCCVFSGFRMLARMLMLIRVRHNSCGGNNSVPLIRLLYIATPFDSSKKQDFFFNSPPPFSFFFFFLCSYFVISFRFRFILETGRWISVLTTFAVLQQPNSTRKVLKCNNLSLFVFAIFALRE